MKNPLRILVLVLILPATLIVNSMGDEPMSAVDKPRIFIASDSTAAPGDGVEKVGWGTPFADFFDPENVEVVNRAVGGRSSRTFITEGHWANLLADVRAGDLVLIQFGHNDMGAINEEPPGSPYPLRARGTIKGLGCESDVIDNVVTGKRETVYTYGHYMRRMVREAQHKGAIPILISLTARNIWKDGRLERGAGMYGAWMYQVGKELNVPFIDLTNLMVEVLEPSGPEFMGNLYPNDHTHTNLEGAAAHASAIVSGLKGLRPNPVEGWLSPKGEAVQADEWTWLNFPSPVNKDLPTLFLIGDSTVRNERGDGKNGQWGWGDFLNEHFNLHKINVVNRAVGGRSSRTFYTQPLWEKVLNLLKPGDFVIMQFGHNDASALNDAKRARGTIKGVGAETEAIDNMVTGKHEVVHTYGWYLRQYISETRAKGATPIVCSPVPRKIWSEDGTLERSTDSYAGWAKEVALQENVPFVDLHTIIADRYDAWGKEAVDPLFADEQTHTSKAGAILNAECVAAGLRALPRNPLFRLLTVNVGD